MKTFFLAVCTVICAAASAQNLKTTSFTVSGNCGMCKKHIEKAAAIDGVTKATWNKDSKKVSLSYDAAKTSPEQVQQKIAAAGYDTEKFRGDDKAYKELDECCQYERKKDNTSKPVKH
jgi:mercuric ion binding protein